MNTGEKRDNKLKSQQKLGKGNMANTMRLKELGRVIIGSIGQKIQTDKIHLVKNSGQIKNTCSVLFKKKENEDLKTKGL